MLRKHNAWYGGRHLRLIVWLTSIGVYALIIVAFGDILKISNNYFVVIPLITAAFAYGTLGGVVSGILALPANLVLFYLIGHMEYAPESYVIAESSGIIIGTALGFLGSRFHRLEEEIQTRIETEKTLQATLEERNLLIREVHHRVKNNLSIIKGMILLQQMSTKDETSKTILGDLANRMISMSLVQDQLNEETHFTQKIEVGEYLVQLFSNIKKGYDCMNVDIRVMTDDNLPEIDIDRITPLGILVNEVVTNAFKHAFRGIENPILRMDVKQHNDAIMIIIADNGPGYDGQIDEGPHMGRKMMDALSKQIRGNVRYDGSQGTTVTITLPI
ncbi:MAG: sensor histidine kinase [Spirochaetaceae bacterium]|nr:sensor histidine kinase [Spirochaetaceae bacterium]